VLLHVPQEPVKAITLSRQEETLFFAKSTFFHAGQRETKYFFTLKLLFFTLALLFFTLQRPA
jgi:hypothetical protein